MHAVVVKVSVEPGHEEESLEHVRANVVPNVKQAPGVVAGYWLAPEEGHGLAITVWESEEAAKASIEMGATSAWATNETHEPSHAVLQESVESYGITFKRGGVGTSAGLLSEKAGDLRRRPPHRSLSTRDKRPRCPRGSCRAVPALFGPG